MQKTRVGLAFLLLGGVLMTGVAGFRLFTFALTPIEAGSELKAIIEVRKGEKPNEITQTLTAAKVLRNPKLFIWVGKLTRRWNRIKAGEYEVSPAQTPLEIFSVLDSGISVAHPITVREGENMYEIAADIEEKKLAKASDILALCKSKKLIQALALPAEATTLEGYLFPDTYNFNKTMTGEEMLRSMVKHFHAMWNASYDTQAKAMGLTPFQLLTLASIIEKETGAPNERPLVSSVFHNRLRLKMRLQSDPTTIYGMWARYKGKIHKEDLSNVDAYNTYTIAALPIGPIGNPGREAIEAALHPAQSNYLFFVSHNDGTHQFSESLEAHNNAVKKFQLDPKAREGKSWRDLNKKKNP